MRSYFSVSALAAAAFFSLGPANAATIVTNGSFENGLTGWSTSGTGTTPNIGITVVGSTTPFGDTITYPASFGSHSAYFVDDNAHTENLFQTVSLTGGVQYNLSFALYGTPSGANNGFDFSLTSLLNVTPAFSVTETSSQVPVGAWTTYDFSFIPTNGGTFTLSFDFDAGPTPAKDVLLDNVSISAAVPEPSTWAMMMLGFVGIGAMTYRRRKSAVLAA
jgi:hypothetical protein